ncbi:MAG: Fe-S cluster assembly protein SufD [Proteobacteria bacterium]|nr:Fe-S cluster assembly protein SufD [Pseudomonadota bacterium]
MNAIAAAGYLESLLAGQPHLPAASPALGWINELRAEAVDRVGELTVPSLRDEDWRFTDISQLTRLSFQRAQALTPLLPADIERFHIAEASNRLVFVDGLYAPRLSSIAADSGVVVTHLTEGGAEHAALIEAHLGRHANFGNNVFAALNTAFLQDAALILVPRNTTVSGPLHVLFIATQAGVASYPRCLLVAETGSAVTLIEDYVALQEAAYFTDAVTEISVADDAQVSHVRVQREGTQGFHIANCAVSLARASRYHSVSVALGARLSRYNLNVLQTGEGAECSVDGLALIASRQLADTHTYIDHARPFGISRQLHKCIVGGAAHAVFNGKIMVRPGAQRTDSAQSSRNLLLSDKAYIDTQPQLEIFADDVKCTHGATVGQLDNEEVFYLTSRGLSDDVARKLLTYAFGAEIIERIPVASLRQQLAQTVLAQTSGQP